MITNVYTAIVKHLQTVTISNVTESVVDGEYVETVVTGTKQLGIFPLTMKDLNYTPEGAYTLQDKKLYEIGSGTIAKKSILNLSDGNYRIDEWSDRSFDGNFTMYIAKRIQA